MAGESEVGLAVSAATGKKSKGTITKDPETVAMTKVVTIMQGLPDDETRSSVLAFVNRKFRGLNG